MAVRRSVSGLALLAVALFVIVGGEGDASAAQLTASWTDNSDGKAAFEVIRRTEKDSSYVKVADVPSGYESYTDSAIAEGITYCYRVRAYTAEGESPFSDEACGSVAASSAFTVAVKLAGTGAGFVASNPSGILCHKDCAGSYDAGRVVLLFAMASDGSRFVGWSGGGCSGTKPCVVTGNTDIAVTAVFGRLR